MLRRRDQTVRSLRVEHYSSAVNILDSYYFNTLLGSFMTRMVPNRKKPRASCEHCADADFHDQYKRRWSLAVNCD